MTISRRLESQTFQTDSCRYYLGSKAKKRGNATEMFSLHWVSARLFF